MESWSATSASSVTCPSTGPPRSAFSFIPTITAVASPANRSGRCIGAAFAELGLHRIIGRSDARNGPSLRLMERLGMRREAHLVENEFFKGEWSDEIDYAILAREWRS